MQDLTLVILAAGMGSRFGGLKQIEPVGPNGEFIIDYSIHDAIKAGFNKVVFVIKEENYEIFKNTIGKRIENKIKVEYVFQTLEDIPNIVALPSSRIKPLGTAHALYCTRNNVKESFGIITADDFYGASAFKALGDALKNGEDYAMIGYEINNTISENGSVKRGICFALNGYVKEIIESKVEKVGDTIKCQPLDGSSEFTVSENNSVSMLMFGLRANIYDYLNKDINEFLLHNKEDLSECEYYLPTVLSDMINKEIIKMRAIKTDAVWMGITYKEDVLKLRNFINNEIKNGVYPEKLY